MSTKQLSIKMVLPAYLALVSILPLTVLGWYLYDTLSTKVQSTIIENNKVLANSLRGEILTRLQQAELLLAQTEKELEVHPDDPMGVLERTISVSDSFEQLLILDRAGRVVSAGLSNVHRHTREDLMGLDLSNTDLIDLSLPTGEISWSKATTSPLTGEVILAVMIGNPKDFVVGVVPLNWLDDIGDHAERQNNLEVFIVDHAGIVLRSPDQQRARERQSLRGTELIRNALNGRLESGSFLDLGLEKLGVTVSIGNPDWILLLAQETDVAFRPLDRLAAVIVTGVLVTFVFAGLIAYWVSRRVTGPMTDLAYSARELAAGNLSDPKIVDSFREISSLSEDFALMAQEIQNRETSLRDLSEEQSRMVRRLEDEIAERRRAVDQNLRLSLAVDQSPASVVITDTNGIIEYINPKFTQITGFAENDVISTNLSDYHSRYVDAETINDLWTTVAKGLTWEGEFLNATKDGGEVWEQTTVSPIRDQWGRIANYLVISEDISDRKQAEKQLQYQANFDQLTGLPNRVLAFDRLGQAISQARREGRMVGLMYLDLDQFKRVNDTMGHVAGDDLLRQAARRLEGCLREEDTIARLGGDEFAIILPALEDRDEADLVVNRIQDAMAEAFDVGGHTVFTTASIGIAAFPVDGTEQHQLIRNADAAMYRAKEHGRDNRQFYSPDINDKFRERLEIETQLRDALARDELSINFQPLIDIDTGIISGAEALLRWNNVKFGSVSPAQFIPVAEDTGLILPIGAWVLRQACEMMSAWRTETGLDMRIAVNCSSRQFRFGEMPEQVAAVLAGTGLPADRLEIEITESLLLDTVGGADRALKRLAESGVRLSIDDFGTGYSSLAYLKQFPIATLKIDQSFIRDVCTDPSDANLVQTIVAMAKSLNLEVVAEGIENDDQLEFLTELECDIGQGYHFAKPMPASEFIAFCKAWSKQNMALV